MTNKVIYNSAPKRLSLKDLNAGQLFTFNDHSNVYMLTDKREYDIYTIVALKTGAIYHSHETKFITPFRVGDSVTITQGE